jgi:hypothetical protein
VVQSREQVEQEGGKSTERLDWRRLRRNAKSTDGMDGWDGRDQRGGGGMKNPSIEARDAIAAKGAEMQGRTHFKIEGEPDFEEVIITIRGARRLEA